MKSDAAKIRLGMGIAAAVLLFSEIMIGRYAKGWVRSYLGGILVVMLIYAGVRVITPMKPDCRKMCGLLPAAVLLFAIIVEALQGIHIVDLLGIKNEFLRTVIGTSFSETDIFCYILGTIPCIIAEILIKNNIPEGRKKQ